MMLLLLASLFARPTFVVKTGGEGAAYALMAGVVARVSEQSLLSRMDGEGVLTVSIFDLLEANGETLSATVLFSYGTKELQLLLSAEGKDANHMEKHLEQRLSSMLLYDGMTFFEAGPSPLIDYTYNQGYASLSSLHTGDHYIGLDAQGNRWATVVVQQVFGEEDPVSLLVGTSGKKLLPGMKLEKQAGKSVSLLVSRLLVTSSSPSFGIEGLYSQEVGLYPFTFVLGGGFDLDGADSSLYGQAGFAVRLPLSMVFGIHSGFWRNSSLAMRCTLGLGYSYAESDLLFGSSAVLTYRYQGNGMGFDVGLGNNHWVSDVSTYSSGLFMQLGLAYTW